MYNVDECDDYDDYPRRTMFANHGSALRVGERTFRCPTCEAPDKLTEEDVRLGYQCDACADQQEQGW